MKVFHRATFDPLAAGTAADNKWTGDKAQSEVAIGLSISIPPRQRNEIINKFANASSSPGVSVEANAYRQGPSEETRGCFRQCLLGALRAVWRNEKTEECFLHLANMLDTNGCAVFAGLIIFQASRRSSMNSPKRWRNMAAAPSFTPLMAYAMGGPVGMTDVRAKDTPPISVNAQDNMLHIDNSPFRQEYKVLLCWDRGLTKGPDGQNFVFLPGAHKGNRNIRHDEDGNPWSTENDSVFLTDKVLSDLLDFQKTVRGNSPTIVEVEYPAQPISVLFSAASLVHHRYRTEYGKPRSCIIAAFHLTAESPGSVINDKALNTSRGLPGAVISCRDALTPSAFISLLIHEASRIEAKVGEIFQDNADSPSTPSSMVDIAALALKPDAMARWRETVINSPSASSIKLSRNVRLSSTKTRMGRDDLLKRITDVIVYDKHGLLDLILYHDGHEEVRKPARKLIWSMVPEQITTELAAWIGYGARVPDDFFSFSVADILEPQVLKRRADRLAIRVGECLHVATRGSGHAHAADRIRVWRSFHQLLIDLAESIVRCEKVETYISTNLFVFWTIHHLLPALDSETAMQGVEVGILYLRCYLALVLLVKSACM
ncbi:hypothetical protein H634G_09726 [Metarhizium anisopliae BRIP 53293]|uniref:Uncharacterized protein n=1 Tax=Metarhizium anisopliae BRIP 53293 TaxID=1291518 RepID=A0A0D9NMH8_METAN|nr:hypothetical protein H634G_09726 [Metarhizium anisopliae BRIP 53293]KJK86487.1 hypothetical protein H633G_09661 [Metarhizium anisopliae BRIP 53284]